MKKKENFLQSISTGVWVFLSVLLIVIASVGLTIYTNVQAENRQKEAIASQERDKKEEEAKKNKDKMERDGMRSLCLSLAESSYKTFWDSEVKRLGSRDGTLPQYNADRVEQQRKDDKDGCYKSYGYN